MTLTLYPHQETGVPWLRPRKAAILADDPGLGKTITALVAAAGWKEQVLVVVPTVALWNWKVEAETWYEGPSVQVVANGKTEIDLLADVVVVTHGLLLNPWIASQLAAMRWSHLIVDEAHKFKSVEAARTAVLYQQLVPRAEKVWFLTGTPCPNNMSEIYAPLRGLDPKRLVLGRKVLTYEDFVDRFFHWRETPYGIKVVGNRQDMLPELKERLDGFILRRLKKDVLPDLPSIRYETVHLRPVNMDKAIETFEGELSPRVLKALRELQDPADLFTLLKKEEQDRFRRLCGVAKTEPVAELLYEELDSGGTDKVVVFAHHTAVVNTIANALLEFGVRTITGATSGRQRTDYVREFQTDPSVRVIVANIEAGGVAITLTAASEVFFAEQSWVPGDNSQAADRCHRIGQTRRVRARFAALAGTIDEAITASLRTKTRMIREVLGD